MQEIWKDVKGYQGAYFVSNLGRVKSFKRDKERFLKPGNNRYGYLFVVLSKNGKCKTVKVHRLVAEAFLNNPNEYRCINHIDGCKTNNIISNLEFCSHSQNTQHSYDNNLRNGAMFGKFGIDNPQSKKVSQISKSGELIKIWDGVNDVRRGTGFSSGNISLCARGKIKSVYGFIWKYVTVLLFLLFASGLQLSAQVYQEDTTKYMKNPAAYPSQLKGFWATNIFRLPDTTNNRPQQGVPGAFGRNTAGTQSFIWDGSQWVVNAGGVTIDSVFISSIDSIFITNTDSIFIVSGNDTIFIGQADNIRDTAALAAQFPLLIYNSDSAYHPNGADVQVIAIDTNALGDFIVQVINNDTTIINNTDSTIAVIVDSIANAPTGTELNGTKYRVGLNPTGLFAGHENDIATLVGAVWTFDDPISQQQLIVDNAVTYATYQWNGTEWKQTSILWRIGGNRGVGNNAWLGRADKKPIYFRAWNKIFMKGDTTRHVYFPVWTDAGTETNVFFKPGLNGKLDTAHFRAPVYATPAIQDSILYVDNGVFKYGTASGGSQNLQQVTDIGSITTNPSYFGTSATGLAIGGFYANKKRIYTTVDSSLAVEDSLNRYMPAYIGTPVNYAQAGTASYIKSIVYNSLRNATIDTTTTGITVFSDNFSRGSIGAAYTVASPAMTVAISAAGLSLKGTPANYVNYVTRTDTLGYTVSENFTIHAKFYNDSTIGTTSSGMAIGIHSQNAFTYTHNVLAGVIQASGSADKGKAFITGGDSYGSTTIASTGLGTISTNDTLDITLTRTGLTYSVTVRDLNTGGSSTVSVSCTIPGSPFPVNNVGTPVINFFGGSVKVTQLDYKLNDTYNPDYMFIGNSIVVGQGSATSTLTARTSNLTFAQSQDAITWAGGADYTAAIKNTLSQIWLLRPRNVIMSALAGNDILFGVSTGTWQANLQTIRDTLVNRGINVIWATDPPRSDVNTSVIKTYIAGNSDFNNDNKIYSTYDSLVNSGTALQTIYNSDGVHPNETGNIKMANLIASNVTQTYVRRLKIPGLSGWGGAAGGGITTLNTLTAATQTFATGTSGSDFNISSATSTHTFNIPDAGASARGLVTTGTQTFAGSKTFSSAPTFSTMTANSIPYFGTGGLVSQSNANFNVNATSWSVGLGQTASSTETSLGITGTSSLNASLVLTRNNHTSRQAYLGFLTTGSLTATDPSWSFGLIADGTGNFNIQSYDGTTLTNRMKFFTTGGSQMAYNAGSGITGIAFLNLLNTNSSGYKAQYGMGGSSLSQQWAFGTDSAGNKTNEWYVYMGRLSRKVFNIDSLGHWAISMTPATNAETSPQLLIRNATSGEVEQRKMSIGQTTLVSGTKAVTLTGVGTGSIAFVTLVAQGGTSTGVYQYKAVCTSNTLTITAIDVSGATVATDTSILNYQVYF